MPPASVPAPPKRLTPPTTTPAMTLSSQPEPIEVVPLARSAITNMPAMRGERADEDEGADLVAVGVDADEARHLGVAAGGVHVAPEDGAAEDEVGGERGDDEEDEAPAEAEDDVGHAEGADRRRQRIDRRAVGDDLDQALADEEHAEGLDEGGDAAGARRRGR